MTKLWLVGVALAAGCARQDEGMTQREAEAAGGALGNGVEDAAKTFGPMTSADADLSCVTTSGDATDPDGDSIPTDAKLTWDCTAMALGYTGTLTGTQDVVDDAPSTATWDFSASADMTATLTGPGGASITSAWTGGLTGTQASAIGPYALGRALDVESTFESGGGDLGGPRTTTTVNEDNDWTITFTPTATWTPGGIIVTGQLDAAGTWNATVNSEVLDATLDTPTPLVIDPACETLVTAGVVTATYPVEGGGDGSVTVTWTGCGTRTVAQEP